MSEIRGGELIPRAGVVEAVDLPRRQLLVLVLLVCLPVPFLTLGGLSAPFPEFAQRALAPLLPFVADPGDEALAGRVEAARALIVASPGDGLEAAGFPSPSASTSRRSRVSSAGAVKTPDISPSRCARRRVAIGCARCSG